MILSYSRRFVFIHIAKTAGESVTHTLAPYLARGDIAPGIPFMGALRNTLIERRHGVKKHSSALTVRDKIGAGNWEDFFTFAFVRNPYDRIRSLYYYLEKIAQRRAAFAPRNLQYCLPYVSKRDPLRWPGLVAYSETRSFSEFLQHPQFRNGRAARSQSAMIADRDGRIIVDFVGKFENLQQDFQTVADRLGIPEAKLEWYNLSRNSSRAKLPLSEDDRRHIHAVYAADFENFGYPP